MRPGSHPVGGEFSLVNLGPLGQQAQRPVALKVLKPELATVVLNWVEGLGAGG